jgi:hypothetical protein
VNKVQGTFLAGMVGGMFGWPLMGMCFGPNAAAWSVVFGVTSCGGFVMTAIWNVTR